jgi:hypothetical protein
MTQLVLWFQRNDRVKKIAKHAIIENQAAPKTQPGGVHGALFTCWYHSFSIGLPISKDPRNNAPKFMKRNKKTRCIPIKQSYVILVQLTRYFNAKRPGTLPPGLFSDSPKLSISVILAFD